MDNVRNFFPALLEADKWLAALEEAETKATSLGRRIADLTTAISSAESRLNVANRDASVAEESSRAAQVETLRLGNELSNLKAQVSEYKTREELIADIEDLTTKRNSLKEDIANLRAKHL
jgi:chromosome segregation ATPase